MSDKKYFVDESQLSNKQDKLIAGTNITIASDGKTISATSGSNVTMTDNAQGGVDVTVSGTTKTLAKESELSSYATKTELNGKASTSVTDSLNTRVTTLENNPVPESTVQTAVDNYVNSHSADLATKSELEDLSEDIADITKEIKSANLINPALEKNYYYNTNGDLVSPAPSSIAGVGFIEVEAGETYTYAPSNYWVTFHDENQNFISSTSAGTSTFTVPSNAKYVFALVTKITLGVSARMYKGTELLPYEKYYDELVIDDTKNPIAGLKKSVNDLNDLFSTKNLFNIDTAVAGYINSANGSVVSGGTNFKASDYIYIGNYDKVVMSKTHIACWYDAEKTFISAVDNMNTITTDATVDRPTKAEYIRFSCYATSVNSAQVGCGRITRNDYIPYGVVKSYNLIAERDTIIVAPSGGDYTSILEACYRTSKDIEVREGTYDIIAEYKALFGDDVFDTMSETDYGGFGNGIFLNSRNVTFKSGAKVVADYTGITVNGRHRFCPFVIGHNVVLDGLVCDCTGGWYVIHDDNSTITRYTNEIKNCILTGHSLKNYNVIGGGCKANSKTVVDNCYLDNGLTSDNPANRTVRYHNTNVANAMPTVIIKNTYANAKISFMAYGSQTTKMNGICNNCECKQITTELEDSASFTVENVNLYKWNNKETVS